MKRLRLQTHIALLLASLCILAGPARAQQAHGWDKEAILFPPGYNYLESAFLARRLPDENLRAFESRAVQKIKDFGDLLQLYVQDTLDPYFLDQVAEQIYSLFQHKSVLVAVPVRLAVPLEKGDFSGKPSKLYQFVQDWTSYWQTDSILPVDSASKYPYPQVRQSKVLSLSAYFKEMVQELTWMGYDTYEGRCRFNLSITFGWSWSSTVKLECQILLQKVLKNFGSQTGEVWEIKLGEIYYLGE